MGEDTTYGTYNAQGSPCLIWACVKVAAIRSYSYYIGFTIKPTPTTCIRVTTPITNLAHNIFTIVTCDNKIVITRKKCNPSTNNCTFVNRSIKRVKTYSIYNRKSNIALIWSTRKTHYKIDIIDYSKYIYIFWLIRSKTTKHLASLTHFLSKILGCNLEYKWGNVNIIVTCDNLLNCYLRNY